MSGTCGTAEPATSRSSGSSSWHLSTRSAAPGGAANRKRDPPMNRQPTRRDILARLGGGFGGLALGYLLGPARAASEAPAVHDVAQRRPHFPAKARAVIQLFMHGGP